MSKVAAGMFRLAAARNDVAGLELLSRTPYFDVDADVSGFTALHAAAAQGHAGRAAQQASAVTAGTSASVT